MKIRYETRADARLALKKIRGAGAATAGLRPYMCSDCNFFHLGHLRADVINGDISRGDAYR